MASVWLRKHRSKNLHRVEYRRGGRETPAEILTKYMDKKTATERKEELEAQFAAQEAAGKPLIGVARLSTVLERWSHSRVAGGHAKRSWINRAKATVEKMATLCKWRNLSDITAESLDRWVVARVGILPNMKPEEEAAKRMAAKGLRMPVVNVQSVLTWAKSQGLAIDDAAVGYRVARGPKKKRYPLLLVEEVGRILVEALRVGGASFATMLEHMALYACRPVDLARLKVGNWNSATREITYRGTFDGQGTKNGEFITHLCHAAHAEKLDRLAENRRPEDPLFVDRYGNAWPLDKNDAAASLCKWYKKHVGLKVAPHVPQIYHLKRFAMTRLKVAAKGNNVLVITMSGHLSPEIVDRYAQTNLEGQRALIAAVPMVTDAADNMAPMVEPAAEPLVIDSRPLVTPDSAAVPIALQPGGKRSGSGFGSLSPEKRTEIALRAYAKAAATGKLHRFTPAEAKAAAKLGGFAVMDPAVRLIAQTIGQETARELGLAFNHGSGKAAREAQLDAEVIVIEDAEVIDA